MAIDKKIIGSRLRKLREEMGSTQNEIAKMLDVTPSCVANWEVGSRAPDINVWGQLAEYFGVSVDYLCCRSNQRVYNTSPEMTEGSDLMLDLSVLDEKDRIRIKNYYDFLTKKS